MVHGDKLVMDCTFVVAKIREEAFSFDPVDCVDVAAAAAVVVVVVSMYPNTTFVIPFAFYSILLEIPDIESVTLQVYYPKKSSLGSVKNLYLVTIWHYNLRSCHDLVLPQSGLIQPR